MQSLIEQTKVVFVSAPANKTGAAATTEWVNMGKYKKCTFLIQTGAWAGGTAAVTLKEAINASGSSSSALAFSTYHTNDGSTSSDALAKTSCSSTFNLDTASALYLVEVNARSLTDGKDFLNIAVASPGANNDYYSVTAILYGGHAADVPLTAIA